MKHLSLFSGLGGFDLAADLAGWENVAHCEINEFCKTILKFYWPNAISLGDIRTTDFTFLRGKIDVMSGGFPCQPYSIAGQQLGDQDERHLWPENLRAIREVRPRWFVGENVSNLVNWNEGLVFEQVQADLEAEGYEVQTVVLPAASKNAPHLRNRIWIIAYCARYGCKERNGSRRRKKEREKKWEQLRSQGKRYGSFWPAAHANREHGNLSGFCASEISQQQASGVFQDYASDSLRPDGSQVQAKAGKPGIGPQPEQPCQKRTVANSQGSNDRTAFGEQEARSAQQPGVGAFSNADPYTGSTGQVQQHFAAQPEGKENGAGLSLTQWHEWPTEPPVCAGDDGLSPELDGITFSAWCNKSIEAAGNAIIPQLALDFFEIINLMDE